MNASWRGVVSLHGGTPKTNPINTHFLYRFLLMVMLLFAFVMVLLFDAALFFFPFPVLVRFDDGGV